MVTGRRAWITLLALLLLCGAVLGMVSSTSSSGAPESLPPESQSARLAQEVRDFPGGDQAPLIGVVTRTDGGALTRTDLQAATEARARMAGVDRGVDGDGGLPPMALPAEDGKAATLLVPVATALSGADLAEAVETVRSKGREGLPAELSLHVTGGPAFGADTAGAFAGADVRLILVSAAVVAVLLLLTYRSPVLWIVPLAVVATADRVATLLAGRIADAFGYAVDGSTSGITSVLVFGAGTNYALLLVSRCREELHHETDHRRALATAVRAATPAILASNITVVLALFTLLAAVVPSTRVLGLSSAVGLLVTLVIVLVGLPAALSLFGRGLFWPFVPRVGGDRPEGSRFWHSLAGGVVAHPWRALLLTIPVLALCTTGMVGAKVGLEQTQAFRVKAESVDGFEVLRQHLPPGEVSPATVIATAPDRAAVGDLAAFIQDTPGVTKVTPTGLDGDRARFSVVLDGAPASTQALDAVSALRDRLAERDTTALVGGQDAEQLDARHAAARDLTVIVPAVLAVVLLVLFILLRGAVAPLLLITATCVSTVAAIGAGTWLSGHVFGFPALDISVPLFAVLFLVALGVDYTIFLVTRAWEETQTHGTRAGTVRAVALTGGVITSAGLVLAAVFVVLGVLPLITLTQIGIIVGIGILLDTFLVRTVVVPALIAVCGDRFWWPRRPRTTVSA